jgi:hypothetical protein
MLILQALVELKEKKEREVDCLVSAGNVFMETCWGSSH